MIPHKMTYRSCIQSSSFTRIICLLNINLLAKNSVEMQLTCKEELFINSLRGLHGLKAKKRAFAFAIEHMGYSYDRLIEIFPTYAPKTK